MSDSSSGAPTAIVAIVAVAVLALVIWFFVGRGAPAAPDTGGVDIDVQAALPDGE